MSLYVDELFDEISRLSAVEREAAIVARCRGSRSLERELRALLAAYDVDRTTAPTFSDEREHEHEHEHGTSSVVALQEGAELGHFRLEERLGQGATASVWRAWDTRLRAYTALKLLDPTGVLRGQQAFEAVLHEARAASAIISDHVIRIKTAGHFDHGPHFVEMELCAERRADGDGDEVLLIGRSLAEVPLDSLEEKVRVVAEAARGVDAAHRVGVLHRDLKPGNILLTPVSRRAKVVDFGLAAEQLYPAPGPHVPSHRTVTVLLEAEDGKVVGTPAYMPPEQAYGQPPTRATDVYALGATLYALVAGDHPYVPDPDAQVPALDVLAQVRRGPPPPLGALAPVPRRVVRIIDRAMARSAKRRYATAGALADDLEAWLSDHPTVVDGNDPLLRGALFLKRHRAEVITLVFGLASLALFSAALGWLEVQRQSLEASISRARVELIVANGRASLADQRRSRAEAEAEAAEEDRRRALRSETDAEIRLGLEREARLAAEQAQRAAEEAEQAMARAREQAEAARASSAESLAITERELSATRDDLANTRERLASTDSRLSRVQERLATTERALDDRTQRLIAAEAALDAVEAETERELAAAQATIRSLRVHVNDLERDVERLSAELARVRGRPVDGASGGAVRMSPVSRP